MKTIISSLTLIIISLAAGYFLSRFAGTGNIFNLLNWSFQITIFAVYTPLCYIINRFLGLRVTFLFAFVYALGTAALCRNYPSFYPLAGFLGTLYLLLPLCLLLVPLVDKIWLKREIKYLRAATFILVTVLVYAILMVAAAWVFKLDDGKTSLFYAYRGIMIFLSASLGLNLAEMLLVPLFARFWDTDYYAINDDIDDDA